MKKIVGTTEDRLTRFMSMSLHWQRDLRNKVNRPASYYFGKYHLGKVRKELIGDLKNTVIDRDWVIDTMNGISTYRAEKERGVAQYRSIHSTSDDRKTVQLINEMLSLGYKVTLERKL